MFQVTRFFFYIHKPRTTSKFCEIFVFQKRFFSTCPSDCNTWPLLISILRNFSPMILNYCFKLNTYEFLKGNTLQKYSTVQQLYGYSRLLLWFHWILVFSWLILGLIFQPAFNNFLFQNRPLDIPKSDIQSKSWLLIIWSPVLTFCAFRYGCYWCPLLKQKTYLNLLVSWLLTINSPYFWEQLHSQENFIFFPPLTSSLQFPLLLQKCQRRQLGCCLTHKST